MRRLLLSGSLVALLGAVVWATPDAWSAPLSNLGLAPELVGTLFQGAAQGRYRLAFGGVEFELLSRSASALRLPESDRRFALRPGSAPTAAVIHCSVHVDPGVGRGARDVPPNAVHGRVEAGRVLLRSDGLRVELTSLGGKLSSAF